MRNQRLPGRVPCPARRRLLKASGAALVAAAVPLGASASVERRLDLTSLHTGESVRAPFFSEGLYSQAALAEINQVLRDHRTGDVHPIDRRLLEILHALQSGLGSTRWQVISGYRSPKTNAMLATRSGSVARRSLHMQGRAIDVRLAGVTTRRVRDAALALGAGGVGYYHDSDFVHLDTGRVRNW